MDSRITDNINEIKLKLNNDPEYNDAASEICNSFSGVSFKVITHEGTLNGNYYASLGLPYSVDSTFTNFFVDFLQAIFNSRDAKKATYKNIYVNEDMAVKLIDNMLTILAGLMVIKNALTDIIYTTFDTTTFKSVQLRVSKDDFYIFSMERAAAIAFVFTFYINDEPYQFGLRYGSLLNALEYNNSISWDPKVQVVLHSVADGHHSWHCSGWSGNLSKISKAALEESLAKFLDYLQ